jgi:iron(III) transport system permease protein
VSAPTLPPEPPPAEAVPDQRQRDRGGAARVVRWLPVVVLLVLLSFLVVLPVGMLVYASFTDVAPRPGAEPSLTLDNYRGLATPGVASALLNSVLVSLGGTVAALAMGGGLAWLVTRTNVPCKRLLQVAGIAPLFISSMIGALAWALLSSPRTGYLNQALEALGIPLTLNVYSLTGMILVFGLYYAPYAFMFVQSALSLMNPELEEAGEAHGATKVRVARRVSFPLIKPAVMGAAILVFVLIFENFPIPTILGARERVDTIPSQIYRLIVSAPPDANRAASLGMILMAIMVTLVYIQRRVLAAREYTTVSGKGFKPRVNDIGRWRWVGLGAGLAYLFLAVVLPAFALLQSSLRSHQYIGSFGDLFAVSDLSPEAFTSILSYGPFQLGLRNTLILGVLTAVIGGLLHFVLAYTVLRTRSPGRGLLEYLAMAPVGIPALVIGMGFLWGWTTLDLLPIYGTLVILALAYIARFMPQGFRGVASSITQVHPDLEDSAIVSGANRVRAVWRITLPLIRVGVVSTMLLLFILSMRELSTSIFLFSAETRILSVVIFEQWESGRWPRAAAISIIYSSLLMVLTVISRKWFKTEG